MYAIIAKAYAKINLLLNITGRLNNGYHTLDGVMIPVSIYDTVRIAKAGVLTVTCDNLKIASGEQNSAYKIAKWFFEYTGIKYGADIFIQKRIPFEAGLGGGSSDAACVLLALNKLYNQQLSEKILIEIAAQCGADIPFFLSGGAKRAQGIGDLLQTIPYHFDYPFVLVKPKDGVNTAQAYRLFHQTKAEAADVEACIAALGSNDIAAFMRNAKNMLQKAGIALCPHIKDALSALYDAGAIFAQMTGSGSAVYGMFENEALSKKAAEEITAAGLLDFVLPVSYSPHAFQTVLTVTDSFTYSPLKLTEL